MNKNCSESGYIGRKQSHQRPENEHGPNTNCYLNTGMFSIRLDVSVVSCPHACLAMSSFSGDNIYTLHSSAVSRGTRYPSADLFEGVYKNYHFTMQILDKLLESSCKVG